MLYQERDAPHIGNGDRGVEMCDAEILDELTTRRGELKVRTVSFNEEKHGQVNMNCFAFSLLLYLTRRSNKAKQRKYWVIHIDALSLRANFRKTLPYSPSRLSIQTGQSEFIVNHVLST